ncbi:MAG: leucine-rich repeat domain-containing protein, partial [Clostridiales bacterium]|nr:leucine-rich repeat domain-containing protein [Clostridiales bacterium]
MAIKFVDETDLSTVGNAIRGKTGGSGLLTFPDGMAAAIAGIQAGGGDDDSLKTVIERTAVNPTLPGDLVKIGDYAFYNCGNLALTSLPDGITSIGDSAFYNCGNLALTSLPDGITRIERNAFYNCQNLALTSLSGGLTSIGDSAFRDCS